MAVVTAAVGATRALRRRVGLSVIELEGALGAEKGAYLRLMLLGVPVDVPAVDVTEGVFLCREERTLAGEFEGDDIGGRRFSREGRSSRVALSQLAAASPCMT